MKKQSEARIFNGLGTWNLSTWTHDPSTYSPHLVLEHEGRNPENKSSPVLVRIHSECLTGDLFHSTRCDCQEQLWKAMKKIAERGGLLLYLRQEGRGIGIIEKLKAYNLQDQGEDTVSANTLLGHKSDGRSYEIAIDILRQMDIRSIDLLTNNPQKVKAFEGSGILVQHRLPLIIPARQENAAYLSTKKDIMGHLFDD